MKLAIVAIVCLGACATAVAPTDEADLVRTPFGLFHRSCVRTTDAAGLRPDTVAACEYEHHVAAHVTAADVSDGWKASEWYETTPLYWISGRWIVPDAPQGLGDQTLYYFPGLEPSSYDDIVQPVLAWNGYGDQAWTMTSWNCCENGNVWHSNPIDVSPGDTVWGEAAGDACNSTTGVCPSWSILSGDTTTGEQTTLAARSNESFTAAQGGVLETYGVEACDELATSMEFDDVLVGSIGGHLVKPTWAPDVASVSPACGYGVTASSNAGVSAVRVTDQP